MDFEDFGPMSLQTICKLYIIITTMILADPVPELACQKVKVGEKWYEKEVFWANLGRPYNLNIHKASNTLFFSYSVLESYSDMDFQLGYYNLETKEHQTIDGLRGGCSVAIDQMYDEIYLGGSDGIYKFNMLTKFADFYQEKGKNIWSLFFRKNLFYVSYPDQKLHIEYEGKFVKVREFENIEIDHFYVSSNHNVIYYANKTGFFKYDNEKTITETVFEVIIVRQIVEDNEETTYVCTNVGVFVDTKTGGFKRIMDLKNVHGLAFDVDNNLIYSDEKNIVRLRYSGVGCDNRFL